MNTHIQDPNKIQKSTIFFLRFVNRVPLNASNQELLVNVHRILGKLSAGGNNNTSVGYGFHHHQGKRLFSLMRWLSALDGRWKNETYQTH